MSQPARCDIAGTGSMVVDLIGRTGRFAGEDDKVLLDAQGAQRLVGGVMLNQLGWASLLGASCVIFGKLAEDANGRFLRDGMARLGLAQRLDLSGTASSFAHVYVDHAGGRAIYMARGATGELTPEEVEARHDSAIAGASWVSTEVSQVPLAAVRRVVELARAAGRDVAVDLDVPLADAVPGLGNEEDLHAILAGATLIKASQAAAASLVRAGSAAARLEKLASRYGCPTVALTLGAAGALLGSDGKLHEAAAPAIDVVDTTGAGDAFLGGLLAAKVKGQSWSDALQLAISAGAACCERVGGFPDDPDACRLRVLELHGRTGAPAPAATVARTTELAPETARFLDQASAELTRSARTVDPGALRAARDLVLEAEREGARVHVTGVGKPEHVARYAAALLASTGTAATFLHATEATHGSVGQLRPRDVVIGISNSGETAELLAAMEAARARGAVLIAVTANPTSSLARCAACVLEASTSSEGGPLELAPRASVLVEALVLQALSVELQVAKGFTREDYHARHPAGALGRKSS